ncbi:MAG: hypothetical protein U0840_24165 [Gemmataceae bacterium]
MFDVHTTTGLYTGLAVGTSTLLLAIPGLIAPRLLTAHLSRTLLAVAALLALVGAAAALLALPPYVWLTATVLAVQLLGLIFLRTAALGWLLNRLARLLSLPRVQSLILLVGGLGLLGWQVVAINRTLQHELNDTDRHMEALLGMPNLAQDREHVLLTDAGTELPLWNATDISNEESDAELAMEYLRYRQFEARVIQTGKADSSYNCHGWVFTGGRAWVKGNSVDRILQDNGYREVSQPAPGDIAVYRSEHRDVMHTSLVRGVSEDGTLLLESKWGKLGRYVHTADCHAYSMFNCTFYTCERPNHQMRLRDTELSAE